MSVHYETRQSPIPKKSQCENVKIHNKNVNLMFRIGELLCKKILKVPQIILLL